jgi:hypothetical protein
MDSLGSDRAVPEPCEASRLGACGRACVSAGICALEEGSERAEDAGARAERHDRCVLLFTLEIGDPSRRVIEAPE